MSWLTHVERCTFYDMPWWGRLVCVFVVDIRRAGQWSRQCGVSTGRSACVVSSHGRRLPWCAYQRLHALVARRTCLHRHPTPQPVHAHTHLSHLSPVIYEFLIFSPNFRSYWQVPENRIFEDNWSSMFRPILFVTGSIACGAKRRYLNYSGGDFEVFRPTGPTRYTDGMENDLSYQHQTCYTYTLWQDLSMHWPWGHKVRGRILGYEVCCWCGYACRYDCLGFWLFSDAVEWNVVLGRTW